MGGLELALVGTARGHRELDPPHADAHQGGDLQQLEPDAAAGCLGEADTFVANNLLSRGQEIAVEVDEAEAVVAALAPGQMSLHHGRLFHASGPNSSDDRRISLAMRYIRPDTPSTGLHRDFAMLMRGADRVGNRINLVPPPGSFTPAHLALYEEVLAAQTEVLADGIDDDNALYSGIERAAHA